MSSFDASIVLYTNKALGKQAQRLQDCLYWNHRGQTIAVTTGKCVVRKKKYACQSRVCKSRWLADTSVASKSKLHSSPRREGVVRIQRSATADPSKGGAETVSHIHTRAHTRPFGSTTPRKGAMPVNCSSISNSSWCARYRMVLRRPCRLVDWTLCCTRFPIPSAYEAA